MMPAYQKLLEELMMLGLDKEKARLEQCVSTATAREHLPMARRGISRRLQVAFTDGINEGKQMPPKFEEFSNVVFDTRVAMGRKNDTQKVHRLDDEGIEKARALWRQGMTARQIAAELGFSAPTIYKVVGTRRDMAEEKESNGGPSVAASLGGGLPFGATMRELLEEQRKQTQILLNISNMLAKFV